MRYIKDANIMSTNVELAVVANCTKTRRKRMLENDMLVNPTGHKCVGKLRHFQI